MFPTRLFPAGLFAPRLFPRPAAGPVPLTGPSQFRSIAQRLGPDPAKSTSEPA